MIILRKVRQKHVPLTARYDVAQPNLHNASSSYKKMAWQRRRCSISVYYYDSRHRGLSKYKVPISIKKHINRVECPRV